MDHRGRKGIMQCEVELTGPHRDRRDWNERKGSLGIQELRKTCTGIARTSCSAPLCACCLCQPNNVASQLPPFVGQHYYCDGRDAVRLWYSDDPLYCGIRMPVPLATLAVTPLACRGFTEHLPHLPLQVLKCAGAKMTYRIW